MKILVINSGSSSLKFKLYGLPDLKVAASGLIEEIGDDNSPASISWGGDSTPRKISKTMQIPEHRQAITAMIELLAESGLMNDVDDLAAIGHRVVHGGEDFHEPIRIDATVIQTIEELIPLAPLHNPANLAGIRMSMELAPKVPQVAVFDTAFHQSIPEHGFLYALPRSLYTDYRVRRYGFHGTSHSYVASKAAEFLDKPLSEINLISLHLGNGASAAAIKHGKCLDTSMGLTPLEGLIMGTRSGDLDPAILFYLGREAGMGMDDLDRILNRESGLKGICGENDMRAITTSAAQGDEKAQLAVTMFCYRLKKYIGSYLAALGGADCLIFTGGIGEHSDLVREQSCSGLEALGIHLDKAKNTTCGGQICELQAADSQIKILVVPTDEEREIAGQTLQIITRDTDRQ